MNQQDEIRKVSCPTANGGTATIILEEPKMKDEIKVIDGKKYQTVVPCSCIESINVNYGIQGQVLPRGEYTILRPLKEKPMPPVQLGDFILAHEEIRDPLEIYVTENKGPLVYGIKGEPFPIKYTEKLYRNGKLIWSKGDE